MDEKLHGMRSDYRQGSLDEGQVQADPVAQFRNWFDEVRTTDQVEPNAMTLATVADGQPSARIVLLKHFDADGFVFFSDYSSRKGGDLRDNPRAALCFWWSSLERQVRLEGSVSQVDAAMSDHYFQSRPLGSQVSASVSHQSQIVPDRGTLERAAAALQAEAGDGPLERPARWGGYRLVPERVEFWQGRSSRLHDRLCYTRGGSGWKIERLSP